MSQMQVSGRGIEQRIAGSVRRHVPSPVFSPLAVRFLPRLRARWGAAARWRFMTRHTRSALATRCSVFPSRADWTPERSNSPDWFEKPSSFEFLQQEEYVTDSGQIESILSLPDQEDHCGQHTTGVFKEMPGAAPDIMRDYDLATLGYEEIEYSFESTATSYELQGERGADGHWDVTPGAEAPFRTRFVARWPKDPLRFSGTVVVEWHNVSAGIDAAPDWGFFHRSLAAAGHAWVGVSAQKVGIDGGGFVESIHLKLLAPERYKDLEHPGDAWSFDIFTQVGRVAAVAGGRESAGRPGADADPRRGRVAVRRLPGDLHQRRRSARAALRRVLRARPAGVGRVHRRRVHPCVAALGHGGDPRSDLVEGRAHP